VDTNHEEASSKCEVAFGKTPPGTCCEDETESGPDEDEEEHDVDTGGANDEEEVQSGT
jgi:hypothetical protein